MCFYRKADLPTYSILKFTANHSSICADLFAGELELPWDEQQKCLEQKFKVVVSEVLKTYKPTVSHDTVSIMLNSFLIYQSLQFPTFN